MSTEHKPHSMAAPDRATLVTKAKNWLAWLEGAGDKPLTTTESLMLALGEFAEAVVDLEEQYQTALDRLWEAHDQLCGCDKPADEGRCSAPEETWGAFEYLGERDRGSNPASIRDHCSNCDGKGHNTGWPHTTCPVCEGTGAEPDPAKSVYYGGEPPSDLPDDWVGQAENEA